MVSERVAVAAAIGAALFSVAVWVGNAGSSATPTKRAVTDDPMCHVTAAVGRKYVSADGRLSAIAGVWFAGDNPVKWGWPSAGDSIHVTGELIGADGPRVSQRFRLPFLPSGPIDLPVAGCWHLHATSGGSTLDFVVRAYPHALLVFPRQVFCPTLANAVARSAAVVVARVLSSRKAEVGTWYGLSIDRVVHGTVKGFASGVWRRHWVVEIVRPNPVYRPFKVGAEYVVFITAPPGLIPAVACAGDMSAPVQDGKVPQRRLWKMQSLESLIAHIHGVT